MSASADTGVKPSRARTVDGARWRRRMEERQTLLQRLVVGALCGLMLEALCICRLIGWTIHSNTAQEVTVSEANCLCGIPNETSPVFKRKPAALVYGFLYSEETGIALWSTHTGGFLHKMNYLNGLLTARKAGYYFLYSKVALTQFRCAPNTHRMVKQMWGYDVHLVLMQSVRYFCPENKTSEVINSYLGGVFHLNVHDSVLVMLEGPVQMTSYWSRSSRPENFFGAFML